MTDNTMIKKPKKNQTHNGLQNITRNTKDRALRIPLSTGGELKCSGSVGSSCSTCSTRRVTLITNSI